MPSLEGKCRLAVLDRLLRYTFLLGTDFGWEKLLDLLSHIKSSPAPALAVTRAMAASDELAEKTAQALQLSEGASPVALEDIAEVVESESVPEQSPDLAISPSLDTSDHLSPANTISDSDLVTSLFAKGWRKVVVGLARALVVRESVKLRREEEPTKLSALYLLIKINEVHGMVANCQ